MLSRRFMSTIRALRTARSLPQLRAARSVPQLRQLHGSAQKDKPSALLGSIESQYSVLTVNALKSECRNRQLRTTGRKAELVSRIVSFEASRQLSTRHSPSAKATPKSSRQISSSAPAQAKGDTSTIDFAHIPAREKEAPELKVRMVVPPDAGRSAPDYNIKQLELNVDLTKKGDGAVHDVSGEHTISTLNENDGDYKKHEDEDVNHDHLSGRDKRFLWGIGGFVALWWAAPFQ